MKPFAVIRNALLMPLEGSMDSFTSGIFVDGTLVPGSLQSRAAPAAPRAVEEHIAGPCIFGGYMFHHYGHFIWETLARLHAIRQCNSMPLLFMSPNTSVIAWQKRIFRELGILNPLRLVLTPTLVDNIILPQEGASLSPASMIPEQLAALAQIQAHPVEPDKKVWLSRTSFMQHFNMGGIINESVIEEQLRLWGWTVIAPETLNLQDQAKEISSAEYVAGFDGSAFFTAFFIRDIVSKYIVFSRRNGEIDSLTCLFEQKSIPYEYHVLPVEPVSGHGGATQYHMPDPQALLDRLREC